MNSVFKAWKLHLDGLRCLSGIVWPLNRVHKGIFGSTSLEREEGFQTWTRKHVGKRGCQMSIHQHLCLCLFKGRVCCCFVLLLLFLEWFVFKQCYVFVLQRQSLRRLRRRLNQKNRDLPVEVAICLNFLGVAWSMLMTKHTCKWWVSAHCQQIENNTIFVIVQRKE